MSHHFDTPTAREDPRVNLCDFYLFSGSPGNTVMALTVNPNAGVSAPDTFRDEGLYAFRFDLDGDAREEVTFKVRFSPPEHRDGDEHQHVQTYQVLRATGESASRGLDGVVILNGRTNEIVKTDTGTMAFAGLAPDLFAGDGVALEMFKAALNKENRFYPKAFENRKNLFALQNVTAIVLEVPNTLIGRGTVRGWASVSLVGHAPEIQVSRWGLPLITHVFMPDEQMREDFNHRVPADDVARFSSQIASVAQKLSALAGSAADPAAYATKLADSLCPIALPYTIDTSAGFDFVAFNGRRLTDDVMDVILTLATNTALGDGVAPSQSRVIDRFPYFGEPYTKADQPYQEM